MEYKLSPDTLPEIKAALIMVPEKNWKEYFEFLRQQQYPQIASATTEKLQEIKQQIMGINLMEHNFSEMRSKKIAIDKKQ